jgi:cbb3-type cytochrome oxidase subunit 3
VKLSDIMGNAGLSFYAQVALVIFFGVFIAVTLHTWAPSRRRAMQDAAMLPLNDELPAARAASPSRAQEG